MACIPRSFPRTNPFDRSRWNPTQAPGLAQRGVDYFVPNAHVRRMRKLALILPLLALLITSICYAYYIWATDEGPPMPTSGYVAMGLGVLFSLVVGCGLMALVFYSHRHGYDERGQGGNSGN
jgi:formate hydrogenlyase subunit 3/multisubunit Na+/H+ antiporter MnhD subunit